ncbi:alpha-glucan family phosphorylase [Pedobacter nutrimenti]|uniref:alpha-glucan family phosphorylase n=1 Tax=Pedobacter nutrimenti TaxID=1241337 RepID=UPI00292E4143|nr:alpha-glucan family phosphorylase [Pedobacter nutrimenti]
MISKEQIFGYQPNEKYNKTIAYFSMEFAIDQSLKIYSGGLGFLAGSHMRSAFELKHPTIGIGMLWKYGYYDQFRDTDADMKPFYVEKNPSFLQDTGITFTIPVHDAPVHVKAYLLKPETFGSAPVFLLSTDIEENDEVSRSITHRLYDSNESTRIAQSMVLGIGGAMLLDVLQFPIDVYHMNEGHSLPLNFYLYAKYQSLEEVKKRVVFTTHTPELAGNESHRFDLLKEMSFFYHLQDHEVKHILGIEGDDLNYTLASLRFARKANGVSKLHGEVAREMWGHYPNICEIISITNAQNKTYWKEESLEQALETGEQEQIQLVKKGMKISLFKTVADQCGKLFDPNVLTLVWARRFAAYKRADLLMRDWDRFVKLINNADYPVQVIWAGKPYPEDQGAIDLFNQIIRSAKPLKNCAVLTGYELGLSALLKKGSDVWLNNPKMYREASGTSGMAAAMNGSINLSMPDGWVPEFAKDMENAFVIQPAADELSDTDKDKQEAAALMDKLEQVVVPMYYKDQARWTSILKTAAKEIVPQFDAGRMVEQYQQELY